MYRLRYKDCWLDYKHVFGDNQFRLEKNEHRGFGTSSLTRAERMRNGAAHSLNIAPEEIMIEETSGTLFNLRSAAIKNEDSGGFVIRYYDKYVREIRVSHDYYHFSLINDKYRAYCTSNEEAICIAKKMFCEYENIDEDNSSVVIEIR